MALKQLLTDIGTFYRDLKYGNDRPNRGSSTQPFIVKKIPGVNDEPTRGLAGGILRELEHRKDDLLRISKWFTTTEGSLFLGKQLLLSRQNPLVPGEPNRSTPLKGFYNPINTLEQIATAGTGLHIEKQGELVLGPNDPNLKYEKVYLQNYAERKNKLVLLYNTKVVPSGAKYGVDNPRLEDFGISKIELELFNYKGGPGITDTIIPIASNSVRSNLDKRYSNGPDSNKNRLNVMTPDQLAAYSENYSISKGVNGKIYDFRTKVERPDDTIKYNYDSLTVNRETRIGLGNPGKRTRDRYKVSLVDSETVDKVTAFPLYKRKALLNEEETDTVKDIIRFRFEVISNSNTGEHTFVHFRAFLGSIKDDFKPIWNPTKFVGRGDSMYSYTGFTRDISLSFEVYPQSRVEMKSMYQKLNYLASTTTPDYEGGYMKGNITRLTIGSYLYRVPGVITNLSYEIPAESPWEIAFESPPSGSSKDMLETPKHFKVNLSFTPLHNFVPQLSTGDNNNALITPDATTGQPNPYLEDNTIVDNLETAEQKYNEFSKTTEP